MGGGERHSQIWEIDSDTTTSSTGPCPLPARNQRLLPWPVCLSFPSLPPCSPHPHCQQLQFGRCQIFIPVSLLKPPAQYNKANTITANQLIKWDITFLKVMFIHSFFYQTFLQHQIRARYVLGCRGEHTALSLQRGTQNDYTKDSLTKTKTIFILSEHIHSKFWRLEVQKASIVPGTVLIPAQYFLVWEFKRYDLELWNHALNYRIYPGHIQKYVTSAVHLDKQVSQFNKCLKRNGNKSFTLCFADITFAVRALLRLSRGAHV